MTDITELAQKIKAAADKATPGEWVAKLGDEVFSIKVNIEGANQ